MLDRMFWSWVSNLKSVNIITNLVQQLVILLLSSFSTTLPQTVNVILLIVHENCKGPRKFMREETPRDSMRVGSQCKSFHLFALPKSKAKDKVCGRRYLTLDLRWWSALKITDHQVETIWSWAWSSCLHWRSAQNRSQLFLLPLLHSTVTQVVMRVRRWVESKRNT